MTKLSMQEVLRQTYNRISGAGFVQMPAREITMSDKLFDGVTANLDRAVPVVDIKTWRNGGIHITCQYYSGKIGKTYDADQLLWIVPRN